MPEPDKIAHQLPAGYFEKGEMAVTYDFMKSPPSYSGRMRILCYQTPDLERFRHFERDVHSLEHEIVHDIVPGTAALVARYAALQRLLEENKFDFAKVDWDGVRSLLAEWYDNFMSLFGSLEREFTESARKDHL